MENKIPVGVQTDVKIQLMLYSRALEFFKNVLNHQQKRTHVADHSFGRTDRFGVG